MKQIPIIPKVRDNAVTLYIRCRADEVRIQRERLPEAKFTFCDTERTPEHAQTVFCGAPPRRSANQAEYPGILEYTDTSA